MKTNLYKIIIVCFVSPFLISMVINLLIHGHVTMLDSLVCSLVIVGTYLCFEGRRDPLNYSAIVSMSIVSICSNSPIYIKITYIIILLIINFVLLRILGHVSVLTDRPYKAGEQDVPGERQRERQRGQS